MRRRLPGFHVNMNTHISIGEEQGQTHTHTHTERERGKERGRDPSLDHHVLIERSDKLQKECKEKVVSGMHTTQ